jgi:SAM-dependent methyltransferase
VNPALRHAWTQLVTAADLDNHMHEVGQAEANAWLLHRMLTQHVPLGSRVLIAGAGTVQFLDYISGAGLAGYDLTLSDINPNFLEIARQRCHRAGLSRTQFIVDDLEASKLIGPFDAAIVVLVLEHIDWQLGLRNIDGLKIKQLQIVIQRNPARLTQAIAPQRKLNASLQAFAKTAQPVLLVAEDLIDYLAQLGYECTERRERDVPDNKTMLGMVFSKKS